MDKDVFKKTKNKRNHKNPGITTNKMADARVKKEEQIQRWNMLPKYLVYDKRASKIILIEADITSADILLNSEAEVKTIAYRISCRIKSAIWS